MFYLENVFNVKPEKAQSTLREFSLDVKQHQPEFTPQVCTLTSKIRNDPFLHKTVVLIQERLAPG